MEYTQQDYENDLKNPNFIHIKDKERFKAFYEELGKQDVQKAQKYIHNRMKFVEPKGKIIELGCHIGFNCIKYAREGFDCIGIDISSTLVDEATKNAKKEQIDVQNRLKFIESDINDLDLKEKFDTVILTETLEHCIDPVPILKKSKELLKKDGKIYASAPNILIGTSSHVRGINKQQMQELVKQCDLKIVEYFENIIDYTDACIIKHNTK